MNATLLTLLLLSQTPTEAAPAPETAAPAAPAAEDKAPDAAAQPTDPNQPAPTPEGGAAQPADAAAAGTESTPAAEAPKQDQPAADASVPRASDVPMDATTPEQKIGKIVSGVVLGVGAVLVVAGLAGLGSAVVLQFSPYPEEPTPREDPRKTAITIASAIAAAGLMLGLTSVLGGAFGLLVG